ncbi:hypothetical protein IWQ57_000988 [Coemansia nantahalensis]|uniref:Uncharacterized protein n=1 Tax=Coemansia nantahalensis TaxID=2789366 RepID=A0ACC1K698_9FUNG|nr:hypothetical protein IWQ57_000988 [Coemansia nantahalensis]
MEFLHANAATLERLEIAVTDATKLYRLLANAVDEPVLYPELRTLILSPRGDPLEYAMIKRSSADYCPKLRYLDVGVLCPFDISLLLQSGYESLEFVRREYFPHVGSLVKLEMARRSLEATKIAPLVLMVRLMCPGLSHVGVPENLVTGCRERLKEEREAVQYRVYHRELANIHFVATK